MCKNESTIALLTSVENTREKYRQQADKFDLINLIKLLSLFTKTESQYKLSNHKRLHVEVALMQACTLDNVRQS